jgi:hypothetical protein
VNIHTQITANHYCIIIVCAYSDYSHLLLHQYCMCILRLQPSSLGSILYCTLILQPSTFASFLYVHTQITAIHSCIIIVCAYSDYSHLLFYHYCMCILGLQPSTHVSLLYVHNHSCIVTVCAYLDYRHPLLYQYCIFQLYSIILI